MAAREAGEQEQYGGESRVRERKRSSERNNLRDRMYSTIEDILSWLLSYRA
jgi:hypothetical protein